MQENNVNHTHFYEPNASLMLEIQHSSVDRPGSYHYKNTLRLKLISSQAILALRAAQPGRLHSQNASCTSKADDEARYLNPKRSSEDKETQASVVFTKRSSH